MLMQSIADPAGILQHPQFQAQTPFFARRLRLARLGINADARWECLRVSSSWVLSLACFAQMVAQHGRSTRASSSPAPASTLMYSRVLDREPPRGAPTWNHPAPIVISRIRPYYGSC